MADDRISNLPKHILCHILSFLPTEDAFATRILSKKWLPLWLSIPSLDFDQHRSTSLLPSSSSFIQFVYAAILGRPIHQPIKTLRLKGDCSNFHAKILLNAIADRKVENLQIDISNRENYFVFCKLPSTIFTIKTLVVLNLQSANFNVFPSSVHLPPLKSLHLENVRFLDSEYFVNLLNGCPILENLKIEIVAFEFNNDPC
ncbi:F-box/FBD/LRR-repeat protein At4g26340-like [Trifolium pratense]|uniref:F-box/FBD/LRR-repeat protein At4g26340-like n=1 Tax=Trifolium pratense TaxID=57577 RepID=UPI001E697EEA|nr:F-box/FBD/LRR-repeat protein At4g26340-like [Trifolium pratense]